VCVPNWRERKRERETKPVSALVCQRSSFKRVPLQMKWAAKCRRFAELDVCQKKIQFFHGKYSNQSRHQAIFDFLVHNPCEENVERKLSGGKVEKKTFSWSVF
jgi:hypothetical protein